MEYLLMVFVLAMQMNTARLAYNQPPAVRTCLQTAAHYEVDSTMNPFYLRGDFNGDGTLDYAVAVSKTGEKKFGILFCVTGHPPAVFAAGNRSSGEDDFKFDAWHVDMPLRDKKAPPSRKREAIFIKWMESGSGLLSYRDGRFHWKQLED